MIYTHAAAAVIALALGFTGGWKARDWKAGADDAAKLRADAATALRRAEKVDGAAERYEQAREGIRVRARAITQEVDRVADRPIYRDRECLDHDGLRLVAAAIGASAPDPGQPAPSVPASGPAP